MNTSSAALKVGLTAIALSALVFFGFRFVAKGISGRHGFSVYALFSDATGLANQSRVQIAGLNVGEVIDRRIEPPPAHPPSDEERATRARVTIAMRAGTPLWSNATIFKKTASLLGEYYLEIDPGTPTSPDPTGPSGSKKNEPLGEGCDIKPENCQIKNVVEAVTTGDVLVRIQETLPILRDILLDVRELTHGPLKDIANSVKTGVDKNSAAAEQLLHHVDAIALDIKSMTGGKPSEDLRQSLDNIREASDALRSAMQKGEKQVDPTATKVQNDLDKLGTAIDNLNRTLENMADVSTKVKNGEGTVGRLLNDDTIANNVEQLTTDASNFLGSITRLQTLIGLRSEYNVVANSLKTYISVQLQSRPDKFFLIELIDDPRGSRSSQRTFTTTDDPTKPVTSNTETVTVTDKFRFSFMLAKRLFLLDGKMALTGRFGIKESSGGIGLDMELPISLASSWFRTFELKSDIFDFRTNIYPRLKLLAALEFYRHIWIVGGLDDAFNGRGPGVGGSTGRDYFFGIQLTFNDDDLRSLLAVGGAALFGSASK